MRLIVLMAGFFTIAACATPAPTAPSASGPWRFSGTISVMDGARVGRPIAGAELRVISGANSNARVTSDTTGHFAFLDLDPGRFTVAVTAPGYVSAAPVVDLFRNIDANFALKPQ